MVQSVGGKDPKAGDLCKLQPLVTRGGYWHHGDKAAFTFYCADSDPYQTRYYYGFRLVLLVPNK